MAEISENAQLPAAHKGARALVAGHGIGTPPVASTPASASAEDGVRARPLVPWTRSLSTKLLIATTLFVLMAEVFVFLPWLSEYRLNWMRMRINLAQVVTIAVSEVAEIPRHVQDDLLARTGAEAIALKTGSMRRLIATREHPPEVTDTIDLSHADGLSAIAQSLDVLVSSGPRAVRLIGEPAADGSYIDMVFDEQMLREAMWRFVNRVAVGSLLVSIIAAGLIYFALRGLFVRPLTRLTAAMSAFRAEPENPTRIITPSTRHDEIGAAERHLSAMQGDLAAMLKERAHLADLGTAVSKINHDLRNILASAQLFTDRISSIPDKTAQRFGPKLLSTLDRAIGYSQAVLDYGKVREAPPQRRLVSVERLAVDVAEVLGITSHPTIRFVADVPEELEVDADPDQLFRVLMNLMRNAQIAVETDPDPAVVRRISVHGRREGTIVAIRVADTGPGVPQRAREKLFRPFEGGIRAGGTGLGLAICAELVRAHGGSIALVDDGPGAHFEFVIPDRIVPVSSQAAASEG
jgi:signal transduction histidine kinase